MSNGHPSERFGECRFEIDPYICRVWGDIAAYVHEGAPAEGLQDPTTIIDCDEDWHVVVRWHLHGALVHHLCGEFCVNVFLESIGPAKEYKLHGGRVKMEPCGDGEYELVIPVPAGTVGCDDDNECGLLYIIAVTLTSVDPCGNPGHIAAYCKGPTLMFHRSPAS